MRSMPLSEHRPVWPGTPAVALSPRGLAPAFVAAAANGWVLDRRRRLAPVVDQLATLGAGTGPSTSGRDDVQLQLCGGRSSPHAEVHRSDRSPPGTSRHARASTPRGTRGPARAMLAHTRLTRRDA